MAPQWQRGLGKKDVTKATLDQIMANLSFVDSLSVFTRACVCVSVFYDSTSSASLLSCLCGSDLQQIQGPRQLFAGRISAALLHVWGWSFAPLERAAAACTLHGRASPPPGLGVTEPFHPEPLHPAFFCGAVEEPPVQHFIPSYL